MEVWRHTALRLRLMMYQFYREAIEPPTARNISGGVLTLKELKSSQYEPDEAADP